MKNRCDHEQPQDEREKPAVIRLLQHGSSLAFMLRSVYGHNQEKLLTCYNHSCIGVKPPSPQGEAQRRPRVGT